MDHISNIKSMMGKKVAEFIWSAINTNLVYTLNISNQIFGLKGGLEKYITNYNILEFTDKLHTSIDYVNTEAAVIRKLVWYKGTPIFIWNSHVNKRQDDNGSNYTPINTLALSTINTETNKKNLIGFVHHLKRIHDHKLAKEKDHKFFACFDRYTRDSYCETMKTMDDVIIPEDIRNKITTALDSFVSKREWYKEHHIPYHFGILLHSEPGSGKSSLAQAITRYLRADMYVLSGDDLFNLPDMINSNLPHKPMTDEETFQVILVEDCDCGFKKSDDKEESTMTDWNGRGSKRKVGLASVLNCLDGLNAPTNTVYIFTTNHIEELDPALIRPGRFDLSIEVPFLNRETLADFFNRFYGESPDLSNISIPDGLTIPELQVKVMEGYNPIDLLGYIKNKSIGDK